MNVGTPRYSREREARVAATPETVKKYVAAKHVVIVQRGTGERAHFPDNACEQAGAPLGKQLQALDAANVLKVTATNTTVRTTSKPDSGVVYMLDPFKSARPDQPIGVGHNAPPTREGH